MQFHLRKFLMTFILLILNILPKAISMNTSIDESILSIFDCKLQDGKYKKLGKIDDMFSNLKKYVSDLENIRYNSYNCCLDMSSKFKNDFKNLEFVDFVDDKYITIEVHNYVRFLHTFCRKVVVPIRVITFGNGPAKLHKRVFNMIITIFDNSKNLINFIKDKYKKNIEYLKFNGNSVVSGRDNQLYCLHINPIYTQLKNLYKYLILYKSRTVMFVKSDLDTFL